jgi:hypothetical protein
MILKFVVDFIDGQAVFLDGKETSVLMSFCLRLLQIYSSHNIGKVRTGILITALFRIRKFSPIDAANDSCSEKHVHMSVLCSHARSIHFSMFAWYMSHEV